MNILQTFTSTLPLILIVIIGIILRRMNLLKESTVPDLKSLVVNLTLPLVLFHAFATMQFEIRYLFIVAVIFSACSCVMMLFSKFKFMSGLRSPFAPFLMAGFEAGMLGYAIFGSIFGEENIPVFAVIDLGQVLFVFFILVTRLEAQQGRNFNFKHTLANFVKTPVIIAIFFGMIFNLTGLYTYLVQSAWGTTLFSTTNTLAGLTMPLVALIIGYTLNFKVKYLAPAVQVVILRLFVWITLALLMNFYIIKQWLGLERIFEVAVLVMAILPAPFVIPIYLKNAAEEDQGHILNTLSIGIVVSLIGAVVIRLFYA